MSQSFNGFTIFDGNRVISNTNLPAGVYNTNAGTSGSLSQFIEKVFFPNTVPSITTNGFTIGEFVSSGSLVGTVVLQQTQRDNQLHLELQVHIPLISLEYHQQVQ